MLSRYSYWTLAGLAAAVMIALVTAGTVAAKGGGTTTPSTCGASPNPVTNGSGYALIGSGFAAGMGVTVYVADTVQTFTYKGTVNSKGTFSISATAGFATTGTKKLYVQRTRYPNMVTYCLTSFRVH